MFCEKCGYNFPEGVQFCPSCGHPVKAAVPYQDRQAQPQALSYQVPAQQQYQAQPYQMPPQQQYYDTRKIDNLDTASFVLGISSILASAIGLVGFLAVLLAPFAIAASIVGLVFAIKVRKTTNRQKGLAGLILNIIGLVCAALVLMSCVACLYVCGSMR
ncbi:MAG: zinc ribbon domain-containing protein [Lachnospiraceae bacterium]|nr:zinc ribbon domain-containing protein [Lachnospiraceae bacterium]